MIRLLTDCNDYRSPASTSRKLVKPSLQVLDDLFGEFVRFRQVVQIDQALVLEPEDVEAGLVAGSQFLVAVAPPAALGRIPFVPGGLAPVAIGAGCSTR